MDAKGAELAVSAELAVRRNRRGAGRGEGKKGREQACCVHM